MNITAEKWPIEKSVCIYDINSSDFTAWCDILTFKNGQKYISAHMQSIYKPNLTIHLMMKINDETADKLMSKGDIDIFDIKRAIRKELLSKVNGTKPIYSVHEYNDATTRKKSYFFNKDEITEDDNSIYPVLEHFILEKVVNWK